MNTETPTGLSNLDVAIVSGAKDYPLAPPFHPPTLYPEYPHESRQVDATNQVYEMVRQSFRLLGLDAGNFGTPNWNPLGHIISKGQRVLLKPNFVLHFNAGGGSLQAVITHPSIIRAVADYVMIALQGTGEIIIGDAPQMNCDYDRLFAKTGMDALAEYLKESCGRRGITVKTLDFRNEQTIYKRGIVWERHPQAGSESIPVVLGAESFMEAIDTAKLYGADYNRSATVQAHCPGYHEYLIARPVLESDVVISLPKLKVHRKVGTTLNLKNMVGINTDKNHLAHYRIGAKADGGDEMANPNWADRMERRLMDSLLGKHWRSGRYPFLMWRAFRKLLSKLQPANGQPRFTYGNWYGNDTAWRMALDLNRILLFADANGKLQPTQQRQYFSVIDGIIGGEGEGPLHTDDYPAGVVLAGSNPLAVDLMATQLMGFLPSEIALYRNGIEQMREWVAGFSVEKIGVKANSAEWRQRLQNGESIFNFRAAAGWQGKIEQQINKEETTQAAASSNILQ